MGVKVPVGVGVRVPVGVEEGVGVRVAVGVTVTVGVPEGWDLGLKVKRQAAGVGVGELPGVVGVGVRAVEGVTEGVVVLVGVEVGVGVLVGVGVAELQLRSASKGKLATGLLLTLQLVTVYLPEAI